MFSVKGRLYLLNEPIPWYVGVVHQLSGFRIACSKAILRRQVPGYLFSHVVSLRHIAILLRASVLRRSAEAPTLHA